MKMSNELQIQDRQVVVPGDLIAEGMSFLPGDGTYREENKVYSSRLGLLSVEGKVLKIVNLAGPYTPKKGDKVIGTVEDILFSGWRVNIGNNQSAVLGVKDATSEFIPRGANLADYFNLDDMVACKITNVTSQNLIDISLRGPGLKKLQGGRTIEVSPAKVPRIIGKNGSMVQLIKDKTGVDVTVGQNGIVWLSGEPAGEIKAVETIRMIESEAHKPGLTQRVTDFLEGK
jgi:exosome complex component RRP4